MSETISTTAETAATATATTFYYNTNPRNLIIGGLLVVLLFFGGLGGMAMTMTISGAIIVPGVVKVSSERKILQHLEGGIVEKIFVKNGDQVKAGDILLKLTSARVDSSYQIVQGMLLNRLAEADRLSAQKDFKTELVWSAEITAAAASDRPLQMVLGKEQEIFATALDSLKTRKEMFSSRIQQFKEQIAGARDEIAARQRIVGSLENEIALKKELVAQRYIDQSQLNVLERQLDENLSTMAAVRQQQAQALERITEIKINLVDLDNGFQEKAQAQLSQVSQVIFELREKLIPSRDAHQRLEISAPVSGTVVNLQIHSEQGGIVRPGETILEIVPEDARLIIEGRLRQDMITRTRVGQKTRVTLSAFNRVTTPPVSALVTYISADSITEQTPYGPQASYTIQVEPDAAALLASNVYLLPGMPAVCYVETEKRTFLQYLIEPITLNMDRALRESL